MFIKGINDKDFINHSFWKESTNILLILDENYDIDVNTTKPTKKINFNDNDTSPKQHHVEEILDWILGYDKPAIICHYGISRSTAISLLYLIHKGADVFESLEYINDIRWDYYINNDHDPLLKYYNTIEKTKIIKPNKSILLHAEKICNKKYKNLSKKVDLWLRNK